MLSITRHDISLTFTSFCSVSSGLLYGKVARVSVVKPVENHSDLSDDSSDEDDVDADPCYIIGNVLLQLHMILFWAYLH